MNLNAGKKAIRLVSRTAGEAQRSVDKAPAIDPAAAVVAPAAQASPASGANGSGLAAGFVPEGSCPKCGARAVFGKTAPLTMTACAACGAPFLTPGRLDEFVILERIGHGEMGDIYRARDEALRRDVAIKVVSAARAEDESLRERLREEARAAARLSHPRVAQVHALGFFNGYPYLVMELVRGDDMEVRLQRDGHIEERAALLVALDITEGLHALHREGLTHGDIKPANIIVDREGRAKLVDFGLSGMARRDGTGAVLGTPHYIAPESIRGVPDNTQTDIYSLGATLYHLLSGRPPFDGASLHDVVRTRLMRPPVPIGMYAPHLLIGTQRIVMRMLQLEPAQRYPDCAHAATEIRQVLKSLEPSPAGAHAPSEKKETRTGNTQRRSRIEYLILLAIAVAEAVVMFHGMAVNRPLRRNTTPGERKPYSGSNAAAASRAVPVAAVTADVRLVRAPGSTAAAADAAGSARPAFSRLVSPKWVTSALGGSGSRGLTLWRMENLFLQGEGLDLANGRDTGRFIHAGINGDFAFSAQFLAIATTHELAKTGLLVRENLDERGPSLFFGLLGNHAAVLQVWKSGKAGQVVRQSETPLRLPAMLRLERYGDRFEAATSTNGMTWTPFASCAFSAAGELRVGLALTSHTTNTHAKAEFSGITILAPAQ